MLSNFLPFSKPSISEKDISAVSEVLRSGCITKDARSSEFENFLNRASEQGFLFTPDGTRHAKIPCEMMFFGIMGILKKERNNIFKWGVTSLGIFFGLILIALLYMQFFSFKGFRLFNQPWKAIMLANSLIAIGMFCLFSLKTSKNHLKPILIGFSPFLLFYMLHFIIPDITIEKKAQGLLLENYHRNINDDTLDG